MSVDYTRIEKSDIITIPSAQVVVDNESYFSDRVVRSAPAPGDPFGVGTISTLDTSAVNLARALVEAYDVALDYSLETKSMGHLSAFAQATWQTHYRTQANPSAPVLENVGIGSDNPLRFKAAGGLTWRDGGWSVYWLIRHSDSYLVANPAVASSTPTILNQGDGGLVPSQTYHDLSVSYRFSARYSGSRGLMKMLERTEVQLGLKNVFDRAAPFDAVTSPRYYSSFGDARLRSYVVSVRTEF